MAAIDLGYAKHRNQSLKEAKSLLESARQKAVVLKQWNLAAAAANRLANLYADEEDLTEARQNWNEAVGWAQKDDNTALEAASRLNIAKNGMESDTALLELQRIQSMLESVEPSYTHAQLFLQLGVIAVQYNAVSLAYSALNTAEDLAKKLENRRLQAQALDQMAELYNSQGRQAGALQLIDLAINLAQAVSASDLLPQLEWKQARLLEDLGDSHRALEAYRRAVDYTQSIRTDIPVEYHGGRSSFRETLGPLYLDLANLLLKESSKTQNPKQVQSLLAEAQKTVELFKSAELQDYYKNSCIAKRSLDTVVYSLGRHTAVLYPIIFPDRLELLLDTHNKLQRFTVAVTSQELEHTARDMEYSLWPNARGQLNPFAGESAESLYHWLISPLEHVLQSERVDTIVFAPYGVLRSIPLAALYHEKKYLVQRYAVATVPGLTLLDPNPLPRQQVRLLAAGLSRPGEVVKELPEWMKNGIIDRGTNNGPRGLDIRALPGPSPTNSTPDKQAAIQRARTIKQLQDALSLPGVKREIREVAGSFPTTILENETFRLKNFENELDKPYRIVHIASHGKFTGNPDASFIMTYDHILNMNKLDQIMRPEALKKQPVELLTLSACETAEGDDRSPLGLVGVALSSGARAALGSLWPVSDQAAQELFPEFYKQLQNPDITKAKALQRAQIKLLQQSKFSHPFYWATFLLVGNWL
jgi:CHAT domain-containing protein